MDEIDLCPQPTFFLLTETMREAAKSFGDDGIEILLEAYIKKCEHSETVTLFLNPSLWMAGGEATEKVRVMAEKALAFILAAHDYEEARIKGASAAQRMGLGGV